MKCHIFSILLLILAVDTECSTQNRFFISAPSVFHMGVNEKVFVQMGQGHTNTPVTLHLEHESSGTLVSKKVDTSCANEEQIQIVELMIDSEIMSRIPQPTNAPPYLMLVAESRNSRHKTRVLVSKRKGYIFIQTDQPMYNPTQKVMYRIFALDQTLRPVEDTLQISVVNAAGNKIMKSLKTSKGGILKDTFPIPDVSKMGTWKITAHYEDDEAHPASREFKVQKFVLPTFEVSIAMDESYVLLNAEKLSFTISAMYSYGEIVRGAYHCQFGVVKKGTTNGQKETPIFIKGLELTGSIQDGIAAVSHSTEKINQHIQHQLGNSLSDLQRSGAQLYLGVFVTNIQSGEIQEAEVSLPIVSHRYTMDFSRTRSYILPGYPLDVVAFLRLPDGSPAAGVQVTIDVSSSSEGSQQAKTDQEGAVFSVFNVKSAAGPITVEVSTDGLQQRKVIQQVSSSGGSHLYMTFVNMIYSVNEDLSVTYNTVNAPNSGHIYYMVLSRGILIKTGTLMLGRSVKLNLRITADMVPSFRLIGYFYNQGGAIIADSVWIDVRDECGIKVKVESKSPFIPGKKAALEIDLHGARAKVAFLAVDKAFYALKADNKLTSKQVFSSMQTYDLGCSYGGGSDPVSVLKDAGLSFVSQSQSTFRKDFTCVSQSERQRRSVDLQQEMMSLKSNFSDKDLQECCVRGFSLIPMRRTCQERTKRVSLVEAKTGCADVFLKCCLEGERLRRKKIQEDADRGLGRTASTVDIEQFFLDSTSQYIRRFFPPSFEFKEFDVTNKKKLSLQLPDSITTWEIQIATLSPTTGFCVAQPTEFKSFKNAFVSLTLPYSVKKYEQISISPVIYNYGDEPLQLAVHMEQTKGLCSPGSATSSSFVKITVEPISSQLVTFSAVPMEIGSIPIKIRLYDTENEMGIDAIEKPLNVRTEGIEKRVEETKVLKFGGRSTQTLTIDGTLPDETVPDTSSNIFISVEGDGFGIPYAKNLLSPERVNSLIVLPTGCLEQTMVRMSPTALALRYLDLSEQWFNLPVGSRDAALEKIEKGYMRILTFKKGISYGSWYTVKSSNWVNAMVVKILSLVAERQTVSFGQLGRKNRVVPMEEIRQPVSYLLTVQNNDGSYSDPRPVLHRGIMKVNDEKASMTAFITLALHRSLQFLTTEGRNDVEASISRATTYLMSHFDGLQHPYAVATTAYCLSVCLPEGTDHSSVWKRLQGMATEGKNSCYLWTEDTSKANLEKADAITVETTAYALLTAVALKHNDWADKTACWLTTQENYFGGYKSTQDTMMALEALSEYELKRSSRPEANLIAEFKVPGKNDRINLELTNKKEKVETNLQKFQGNNVLAELTGQGDIKLKIVRAYHLLEPKDNCDHLSIRVTVEGKVKYIEKIVEVYEYYDEDVSEEKDSRVPRSAIEWFDARTRNRRDVDNDVNSDNTVTYSVCVSYSLTRNLTGMAIADITLLSGFQAVEEDLDKLKEMPEQYISHYETSYGRVLLYFNELFESEECISFDAKQLVPIGLLQPAPASFYDYYEPQRKCTVFYSAPRRSKMVSKLCSEDVCQCAERPCHKVQSLFKGLKNKIITKEDREEHACFFPRVDYAYIVAVLSVSVKSNFELYKMNVNEVLRSKGDVHVTENSVRVFAKRRHCKGQLDVGKEYLIMGKDGLTTDSNGEMQYLLESITWVEKKECDKSSTRIACKWFNAFISEYKLDGCRQ